MLEITLRNRKVGVMMSAGGTLLGIIVVSGYVKALAAG